MPSYVMAKRSFPLLQKLENWGIAFPKDSNGDYQTLRYFLRANSWWPWTPLS